MALVRPVVDGVFRQKGLICDSEEGYKCYHQGMRNKWHGNIGIDGKEHVNARRGYLQKGKKIVHVATGSSKSMQPKQKLGKERHGHVA